MGDAAVLHLLEESEKAVRAALARRAAVSHLPPLRLIVHVLESTASTAIPKLTFVLHCGRGDQTFRWLSLAVATRLQHLAKSKDGALRTRDNHELSGFFLPAAVNTVKSAQLALDPAAEGSVQPNDVIRDLCRDGDEIFVTLTTKASWDEAGNLSYSAWQDAAYHRFSDAAEERQRLRAEAIERDTRLAARLTKLRDAGWDVGTAIRMQRLIGAATTAPAAPLPVAFGLSRAASHGGALATSPATGEHSGASTAEVFALSAGLTANAAEEDLASSTPWLSSTDLNAMFENDWRKLQCVGLLPTARERDALRSTLQRAFGPIRDVFRYYSNILNASVATKDTKEIADAFRMSRSELELFMRDCRVLNAATMPFLLPGQLLGLITTGELRRQAAQVASNSGLVGGPSTAGGDSHWHAGRAFDFSASPTAGDREPTRFIGEITSPVARRAVLGLRPRAGAEEHKPDERPHVSLPADTPSRTPGLGSAGMRSALQSAGAKAVAAVSGGKFTSGNTPASPDVGKRGLRHAGAAGTSDKSPRGQLVAGRTGSSQGRPADELDRAAFIDALVLIAAGLWEASRGDKGAVEAVRTAHLLSSNSLASPTSGPLGGDGGKRPGVAGAIATFTSPRVLPGATASLSSSRLPSVRAHMVAHFLSTYLIPRSKKVHASSGVRRELTARKVSAQILRELPMLRQAFKRYANLGVGDDVAMDLAGWRKMLVDVGLFQRAAPSGFALPTRDAASSGAAPSPASPSMARGGRAKGALSPKAGSAGPASASGELADVKLNEPSHVSVPAPRPSAILRESAVPVGFAGLDNMKGKRMTERDVVMTFLQAQNEDEGTVGVADADVDNMVAGVAAGARGMTAALSTTSSGLKELSFSEWIEALARVAMTKWDDPAMPTHEKLARVIDSIAVRMITEPGPGGRGGMASIAVHDVARVMSLTSQRSA